MNCIVNKNKNNYFLSFTFFLILIFIISLVAPKKIIAIIILYLLYLLSNFFETKLVKVCVVNDLIEIEYIHLFKKKAIKIHRKNIESKFKSTILYGGYDYVFFWIIYVNNIQKAEFTIRKYDLDVDKLKELIGYEN